MNLPIPAEIVGDTETLRQRLDDADSSMASWGRVIGRTVNDGRDPATALELLAEALTKRDAINGECARRRMAFRIARGETGARP